MKATKMQKGIIEKEGEEDIKFLFPEGKLSLVLKLISNLVYLLISESNIAEHKNKIKLINEYEKIFKEIEDSASSGILKAISDNVMEKLKIELALKIFNKDFIVNILNAMKSYNKYVKNEINIDSLLDQLISLFSASVIYVKNIDRKAISFELINNLYKYLDDISNRNNNLKSIISKKKFKKEEFEIKEKENIDAAFNYQIEKLRKLLEEKDKELKSMSEKCINTSLNSRYYEQQVDILTAEKDASAKETKEIKINIMELKNIINNHENMIRRLEKKLDAMDARDAKIEENTKLIKDLENKINILMNEQSENAQKIKMLEDEISLIKKKLNELTKYTNFSIEQYNNLANKFREFIFNYETEYLYFDDIDIKDLNN
jgi:chromosome segregation ATPase